MEGLIGFVEGLIGLVEGLIGLVELGGVVEGLVWLVEGLGGVVEGLVGLVLRCLGLGCLGEGFMFRVVLFFFLILEWFFLCGC